MDIFISDLDGTLLGRDARISKKSIEILTELLEAGMLFTVATARTQLSVPGILETLPVKLPLILMNGAVLYERETGKCLSTVSMKKESISLLARAEEHTGMGGLLFAEEKGFLKVYEGAVRQEIFNECCQKNSQKQYGNAESLKEAGVVYGLYADDRPERLEDMCGILKQDPGLTLDFYEDIYRERRWCLEITSSEATKGKGADALRELFPTCRLIGFGDGWNDLSLLKACDEFYAAENGDMALKIAADGIVAENTRDGVALYLKERWKRK